MDDQGVIEMERDLWIGEQDVYRRLVARDCLMVLPEAPFIMSGEHAIEAVSHTPRWTEVDLDCLQVSRPHEGLMLIAYKAMARKGGQAYEAYCTSTYHRRGDDEWKVIQHQQTVLAGLQGT